MAVRIDIIGPVLVASLALQVSAWAQGADAGAQEPTALRRNEALLLLDYQVLDVRGDKPIDLMGFHLFNQVAEGLYVGAGMSAPLVRGAYGGFATFDLGAHVQQRLTSQVFATGGLAIGAGAGGRNVENAKSLAGTGGFVKGYVGLGYDFGAFALGANLTTVKFSRTAALGGTQADLFLEIPFTYLTGPFSAHGQPLSAADTREAAEASSERMVTLVLDNYRQQDPQGTFKGSFNIFDLQYSQFLATDTYWFVSLGMGYRGLPLSNQLLGGVGQRLPISANLAVYGQLGIGSGIYAPEVIDTGPGLVVYPKVAAELALSRDLGLSLSAGYLVAPKGSSKNRSIGIAFTRHLRANDGGGLPSFQAFRFGLFQETDLGVRYRDLDRGQVRMVGIQIDTILDEHWYLPLRGTGAYSTYLGYPGYGELLGGFGWQTRLERGERWQGFGQLMAGTNVHGLAVKGSAGLRFTLDERTALSLNAGRIVARSAAGNRFTANSVSSGWSICSRRPGGDGRATGVSASVVGEAVAPAAPETHSLDCRHPMNLKFVETFLVAARLRSFSRAALQLHTTPAGVSARIQNLEDELGTQLFDRDGRQLTLTAKGLELLSLAERLLHVADEFEARAKDPSSFAGRVRLGIIDTAANAILAPLLREVEARFPRLEVDLQADTSQRIVERMAEGDIDIGITLLGLAPPEARVRRLLSLACHWVAAPSLVPEDREMSVAELATHAVLSFAQGSQPHERTRTFLAGVGGARRMYCGTSLATMLRLAVEGLGISVMPAALVQDELASGRLRVVRCAPPFRALDIQVSWLDGPGRLLHTALAEAAVDVARRYCAGVRPDWAWIEPEPSASTES